MDGVGEGWGGRTLRQVAKTCGVLWITPVCLVFAPTPATPQEGPDHFRTLLDSVAPVLLAEHEVPGLIVAYLHDGVPALTKGYGVADPSSGRVMEASTQMNVASLSKPVTAWGVLRLAAEGHLDLAQPANERLTRWRLSDSGDRSREVTAGRLLGHTAGLNVPSAPMVPLDQANMTLEAALSGEVDGTAVAIVQEPDASWQYSGGGYMVLELLVEEVSGQRFDDFMRATVFEPNLMTGSTFSPTGDEIRTIAAGTDSEGNPVAPYRVIGAAAGGLVTNAADMGRLLSGYFERPDDGATGPSEMAAQLLSAPTAAVTIEGVDNAVYGYGHGVSGQGPDQTLYHSGGNPGVVAYMIVAPYRGIALFLAANSDRGAGVLISLLELWADFHRIGLPPLY